jgi:indole-3-glycerol phosphate synthase
MNILENILLKKALEVRERKMRAPVHVLMQLPAYKLPRRSLLTALRSKKPAVLAEIKRASPSKGVIRHDFDPAAIARSYVEGGAAALSVLTDESFFGGKMEFLSQARDGHSLPVLRKDFIVDPYQLIESRAYGADAVLLIVAALGGDRVAELQQEAALLGLEAVVEIHNEAELAELNGHHIPILGMNNRDLSSFDTDIAVSLRLASRAPADSLLVSESGISTSNDLEVLGAHGIHAVLVGEAFMRAEDPGAALKQMLAGYVERG